MFVRMPVRLGLSVLLVAGSLGVSVRADDARDVTIRYRTKPTMELPPGLETVAVLDSETKDDAERKWSQIAANMISGMLSEAASKGEHKLVIADRENLKKVMAEKDLALAGIVDGAKAAQAAKVLGVQGIIASSIKVKVEKHKGKARTIGGFDLNALRHRRPGAIKIKQAEKVTRHITVQCKFRLLDAANAKVLIDHVSPLLSQTDRTKVSKFFGSSKGEAELTPRDQIIANLVEEEVARFIGKFFPVEVEYVVHVDPSGNDDCEAGVKMLAVGEIDEAIRLFEKAVADDDDGDKKASFAMGVAYEAKGDLETALQHYRIALRQDYKEAVDAIARVRERQRAAKDG